ncbi:Hypothetical protein A7982_05807 [Minicystis rosea]|nr:Hypothetical protein A7982_05807 [Minicystis rosea]
MRGHRRGAARGARHEAQLAVSGTTKGALSTLPEKDAAVYQLGRASST